MQLHSARLTCQVLPEELNKLLIIVVVISMALTPTLAEAGAQAYDFVKGLESREEASAENEASANSPPHSQRLRAAAPRPCRWSPASRESSPPRLSPCFGRLVQRRRMQLPRAPARQQRGAPGRTLRGALHAVR